MGPPDLVPPGERLHQHGWRNYLNAHTTNRPQAEGGPTIVSQVVYRSRGANPSFETQILACVPTANLRRLAQARLKVYSIAVLQYSRANKRDPSERVIRDGSSYSGRSTTTTLVLRHIDVDSGPTWGAVGPPDLVLPGAP